MAQNSFHINLPLEALILRLKKEGFEIDVPTHLRIQQVLLLFGNGPYETPQKLKSLLCPIIARSKEEQARFGEIFDLYFQEVISDVQESEQKNAGFLGKRLAVKNKNHPARKLLIPALVIFVGFLITYGWYVFSINNIQPAFSIFSDMENTISDSIIGGDNILCSAAFEAKKGQQLEWDFGDTATLKDSMTCMHQYSRPGKYTVQLHRSFKFVPFSKYTVAKTINVCIDKPNASFLIENLEDKGKETLTIQFTPAVSNNNHNDLEYKWTFGDGDSSYSLFPTHHYRKEGFYNATLIVTDKDEPISFCASDTFILGIKVASKKNITATIFKESLKEAEEYKLVSNYEINIFWLLVVIAIPFIFLLVLEIFLYRNKAFYPSKTLLAAIRGSENPPFEMPFPNQNNKIQQEKDQQELANKLRQRIRLTSDILDVKETVHASLKNGGFPIIRYRSASKPPEYLVLIDKSKPLSQHIALAQYLTNAMLQEDVFMEIFYFRNDPGICHNDQYPDGISLEKLKDKFPDHKLILIGTGHQLLDKKKPRLQPSLKDDLNAWKQKVLISTHPQELWSYKENILQQTIPVLSGDLEGYLNIPQIMDEPENTPENSVPRITLKFDSPEEIKKFLNNEPLFQWFCASALYPRMSWEILLYLGQQLSSYYNSIDETLEVNYSNLYKICQIIEPEGEDFQEHLRAALLRCLDPKIEKIARKALAEILESITIPEESFLREELETQKLYNNFILNPTNKEYAGEVNYLIQKGLITDKIYQKNFTAKNYQVKDKEVESYFKPFKQFSPGMFLVRFFITALLWALYMAILVPNITIHPERFPGKMVTKKQPVQAAIVNNFAVQNYDTTNIASTLATLDSSITLYKAASDSNSRIPVFNKKAVVYNKAIDLYSDKKFKDVQILLSDIEIARDVLTMDIVHLIGLSAYYDGDLPTAEGWYKTIIAIDSGAYFETQQHPNLKDLLSQHNLEQKTNASVLKKFSVKNIVETRFKRPNDTEFDYKGGLLDGKPNGFGTADYQMAHYQGYFNDGLRSGKGTMRWDSGDIYVGEWKNDKRNGKGDYEWAEGIVYSGEWKDNKKDGYGTNKWPSGEVYSGYWKNDDREGEGKCTWPSGQVYTGQWKNGKREGEGKCTWPSGEIYNGQWKDGTQNGMGDLIVVADEITNCPGAHRYVGNFVNNRKVGEGTCYDKDGNILYTGRFENNKPVDPYPQNNVQQKTYSTY